MNQTQPSQVTPEHIYLSRREILKRFGILIAGGLTLSACRGQALTPPPTPSPSPTARPTQPAGAEGQLADEFGDPATPLDKVRRWGNYYEFTRSNEGIQQIAKDLRTSPWKVEVGGLVRNPKTFDLDDLRKFGEEERIYRMRCMQAWSMVIPWTGFPLHKLLSVVEPTAEAKYVRFDALYDPQQMPGQNEEGPAYTQWLESGGEKAMGRPEVDIPYVWPYAEALRLDEAMHDLTILATGVYGKSLYPENGAPVRLVVPWKYAFKSIKAIVRIELVSEQPATFWNQAMPAEMGWYANVNPDVPSPRWKQGREMRFLGKDPEPILPTLMFNGYASEVAYLYAGMDLERNF
jgi:sulfoxide reductase catalytic subunit YedY